jgi:hypothetical protein
VLYRHGHVAAARWLGKLEDDLALFPGDLDAVALELLDLAVEDLGHARA